MGRLLMVESWVGATGRLLPPKISELYNNNAKFQFN